MKPRGDRTSRPPFAAVISRMVAVSFRAAPWAYAAFIGSSLGFTFLLVADLHYVRVLLDDLPLFADGRIDVRAVLLTILLLGGVNVVCMLMNACLNLLYEYLEKRTAAQMTAEMAAKATRVDLVRFESVDLYDSIEKAVNGRERSFSAMEEVVFSIIFHGGYFLFLGLYLVLVEPWLVLGIFASFLPVAFSRYVRASAFYRTEDRVAPVRRRFRHYEECLTDRSFLKETRTAGATGFFGSLYGAALAQYNREMWRTEVRTGAIDLGLKVLTLAGYAGLLFLLIHFLFTGTISAGMFGAVYFAMASIFKWFEELFGRLGSAYESAAFAGNYFSFLAAPERRFGPETVRRDGPVTLDGLTFRYPGASEPAVAGVSLEIPCGQTLAVVGRNGAGKTTLVKLIAGLLTPDEGSVRCGGVELRDGSAESIYRGLSAVFQTFGRYRLTLGENVAISDLDRQTAGPAARDALEVAGFPVSGERLPDRLDTLLSREFGGTDFSGGEWQRVAIARGLHRRHDAIILDEPTASIDPIEEARVYRAFVRAAHGRTAIIVTHRLGSARIADRIIVMEAGRVVEDGTHDQLMAADGGYARMYRAQAQWYARS